MLSCWPWDIRALECWEWFEYFRTSYCPRVSWQLRSRSQCVASIMFQQDSKSSCVSNTWPRYLCRPCAREVFPYIITWSWLVVSLHDQRKVFMGHHALVLLNLSTRWLSCTRKMFRVIPWLSKLGPCAWWQNVQRIVP